MRQSADNKDGTSDFAWCKSVVKERFDKLTEQAKEEADRAALREEARREVLAEMAGLQPMAADADL